MEDLDLSRNCLSDFAQAILIDEVEISHSLKRLNLCRNRLTDQVADDLLTKLWKFPALEDLDLSFNGLSKLEFPNFLSQPRIHRLKDLRLFHPYFCCLDPGEEYSIWLLQLLQKTPNQLKIGSFWGCKFVETQHLLDTRQVYVHNAEDVPLSLWSHAIAQANSLFQCEDSRQADAVFYLLQSSAISSTIGNHQYRRMETKTYSDSKSVIDTESENATFNEKKSEEAIKKSSSIQALSTLDEATVEPSSEFMTCSLGESEMTDDQSRPPQHPLLERRKRRSLLGLFRRLKRNSEETATTR